MGFYVNQFNFRGTHTASLGMVQDKLVFKGGLPADPFNFVLTGSRQINNDADVGLNSSNALSWLALERIDNPNTSATLFISGSTSGSHVLNTHDPRQIMANLEGGGTRYTIRDLSVTRQIDSNFSNQGWTSGITTLNSQHKGQRWFVNNNPLSEPSYPDFYVSSSGDVVAKTRLVVGKPADLIEGETSGSGAFHVYEKGGEHTLKVGHNVVKNLTGTFKKGVAITGVVSSSGEIYAGGEIYANNNTTALRTQNNASIGAYKANLTGPNNLIKADGSNVLTIGSSLWTAGIWYGGGSAYLYSSGSGAWGLGVAFPFKGSSDKTGLEVAGAGYFSGTISGSGGMNMTGSIIFNDLPGSDPGVAGQLWNSSGTLKVSAG